MSVAPKDIEDLRALCHCLATQDGRCTSDPFYVVQRKARVYGFDTDYTDEFVWIDSCNDCTEADADEAAELEAEYQRTLSSRDGWVRTGYQDRWEPVQWFLTDDAAQAYLESQRHNLGEARVYVDSAYRNPEIRLLRRALPSLVETAAEVDAREAAVRDLLEAADGLTRVIGKVGDVIDGAQLDAAMDRTATAIAALRALGLAGKGD